MVKITRKDNFFRNNYPPMTIEIELSSEEAEIFDFIWRYCGSNGMKGPQSIATHIPLSKFEDFRQAMWEAFSRVLNKNDC